MKMILCRVLLLVAGGLAIVLAQETLTNESIIKMVKADFSTGDYDRAIDKFKAILAEDPKHFDAQLSLGMAYYRKGDYPTAIAEGRKAEKLKPGEQLVHTNLSLFYMKAGEKGLAEHHGMQARISSWKSDKTKPGEAPKADPDLELAKPQAPPVNEIGVYYKKAGAWADVEPEVVNWKTGGVLKSIGSAGIVKGDVNGHLNGQHSPNSVKTPLEFLIYVPEGVAITEYQLLRLRDQKEAREFRTVTGGVLHVSGGATRDLLPFESKKIAPRTYVVVLPNMGFYLRERRYQVTHLRRWARFIHSGFWNS